MHPYIARNLIFPLQERLKGKNTFAVLKELEKTEWNETLQLQELQIERL